MSSSLLFGLSSISFIMMFPSSLSSALDPPVALSVEGELVLSPPSSLLLLLLLSPLLLLLLLLALLALPIRCVISSALGILSSSLGWATAQPIGATKATRKAATASTMAHIPVIKSARLPRPILNHSQKIYWMAIDANARSAVNIASFNIW